MFSSAYEKDDLTGVGCDLFVPVVFSYIVVFSLFFIRIAFCAVRWDTELKPYLRAWITVPVLYLEFLSDYFYG